MPQSLIKQLTTCPLVVALVLLSAHARAESVPGGVYVWPIPSGATAVRFENKPVFQIGNVAIIGIPISTPPGQKTLQYQRKDQPLTHDFKVTDKQYTEQHITLENQNMVDPPAATLARIREESARQRALYNSHQPATDLSAGFVLPLEGITTSLYGHRRFFNGQPRSPHSGLDIAAPEGTPIAAAASGVVTLADNLYFNGNTLFVDHGQGLITMYCHMSEILVNNGAEVKQGETIGLVGSTGRATGPHLHWSVSLNGSRVDPEMLMQAVNTTVGVATSYDAE